MTVLNTAPAGAEVLDLGAARAAQAEASASLPNKVIKLEAGFVELRPIIDLLAVEDILNGQYRKGIRALLVDPEDADVILAGGISQDDLEALTEFITSKSLGE